jgi:squalene cyclase
MTDKKTEQMLEEMRTDISVATLDFQLNQCKECVKKGLQKERGCAEADGGWYKGCSLMENYIRRRTKHHTKKFREWLDENFGTKKD